MWFIVWDIITGSFLISSLYSQRKRLNLRIYICSTTYSGYNAATLVEQQQQQ
jgi:hypothetical protein